METLPHTSKFDLSEQTYMNNLKLFIILLIFILSSCAQKFQNNGLSAKEIENFDGRINIRKSGTESMIRIMVESLDEKETINISNQLTKAAQQIA